MKKRILKLKKDKSEFNFKPYRVTEKQITIDKKKFKSADLS